jgi:hypothetical protein
MADMGAQACTDCPTGFWVQSQGSTSRSNCSICAAGYERVDVVSNDTLTSISMCAPCQPGLFTDHSNSSCSECITGKFAGEVASTTCSLCPEGRFSETTRQMTCQLCPPGKFGNFSGSTSPSSCSECPPGKYATSSGNSFCASCDAGRWSNIKAQTSVETCKPCPLTAGVICPTGSIYPIVSAGNYRTLDSPDLVYTCVPAEACLAADIGNTSCSTNYNGFRCSFCADGFFRYGGKCLKCLPVSARWCILIVACFGFLLALKKISSAQDLIPPQVKMTFMWIQMLALFPSLSTAWPASLQAIFNLGSFLNFDVGYLGLGCDIRRAPYFPVLLVKITLPFIFLLFLLVSDLLVSKGRTLDVVKTLSHFLFVTNFFSIQLFSSLFQAFNCVKHDDGSVILYHEPSISCQSSDWITFISVDSLFIFFYIIVIPAWLIFKCRSSNGMENENTRKLLGPLTQMYRKGAEWFELSRLAFRLCFVILRDALQVSSTMKISLLIFLLMYQAFVESRARPYAEKAHNDLSLM